MSNQTFGEYECTKAADFRAYDRLPAAYRQLLQAAPSNYAAEKVLDGFMAARHAAGNSGAIAHFRGFQRRIASKEAKLALKFYGPEHPAAQGAA